MKIDIGTDLDRVKGLFQSALYTHPNEITDEAGNAILQGFIDQIDRAQEKRAPVQRDSYMKLPGTISWEEHLEAWHVYHQRWKGQDAQRIADRGGFGYREIFELIGHYPETWRKLDED